eukprot:CAMPEP_0177735058 /NCGR_PEP_ID=MMETSP0484_2-20121128/24569_1 /TAXON_ID=354590 /ORGANISM="Rhodomonas lens, Strain RHODO" /LENGTH=212 /DNA_ID=CAMNT_0019248587 /DNA_START=93 /DNA_END=727 /DNA_ORIENTATION=-
MAGPGRDSLQVMAGSVLEFTANLGGLAGLLLLAALFCQWWKSKKKTASPQSTDQSPPQQSAPEAEKPEAVEEQMAPSSDKPPLSVSSMAVHANGGPMHIRQLSAVKEDLAEEFVSPESSRAESRLDESVLDGSLAAQMAVVVLTIDENFAKVCASEHESKTFTHSLRHGICEGLGFPLECVQVGALRSGSVLADVAIASSQSRGERSSVDSA